MIDTLTVDGWAVTFGTARRGLGSPPRLLAVPNVTAHPLTASVPTSYYSMWHIIASGVQRVKPGCHWFQSGQIIKDKVAQVKEQNDHRVFFTPNSFPCSVPFGHSGSLSSII